MTAGESFEGHQHRWLRGSAQIDVLVPRGVGERALSRRGVTGGTTIQAPGAQQALNRTELPVSLGNRTGTVLRPNLLGALVAKAAAHTVSNDVARGRHVTDFLVLTTLIDIDDVRGVDLSRRDRNYLRRMVRVIAADRTLLTGVADAAVGVQRLRLALGDEP